jgi:hypothetical protein
VRRVGSVALALGVALIATNAHAESTPTLEAGLGSPFSFVRGSVPALSWLALGPRVDLIQSNTLRAGVETSFALYQGSSFLLQGQLLAARAFGFADVISTWNAELSLVGRYLFDERWSIEPHAGLIGYVGGLEASQHGALGLLSGRVCEAARCRDDRSSVFEQRLAWREDGLLSIDVTPGGSAWWGYARADPCATSIASLA